MKEISKRDIIEHIKSLLKSTDKNTIIEKARVLGMEYEQKYWGCGQSVALAVMDALDMRDDVLFRATSGFGAGIGLSNKSTCCALLGAVAVIGYVFGRDLKELERLDRGIFCYRVSRKMILQFEGHYGHLECSKLQESLMGRAFNLWDKEDFALFEKAGGHSDKCPSVVSWCAAQVTKLILENI